MNYNYADTITIFNKLKAGDNDGAEVWYKTILKNCFFKVSTHVSQLDVQATLSSTYTARIPDNPNYINYQQWKSLGEESRGAFFTVSEGDIIVLGEIDDDITGEPGETATEILRKYKPDAFRVTVVSDNTRFLSAKHIRVGG